MRVWWQSRVKRSLFSARSEPTRREDCAGTDGIPTWQDRGALLRKLIEAGFNDRLFLASDWMFGLTIAPTGTMDVLKERNPLGNLFDVRNTIPYLRQMGVSDEQIRTITVANPRAFFARG